MSNGQPGERWHTDIHTDGTDFIPSTADAGGKYRSLDVDIKTSLSFWSVGWGQPWECWQLDTHIHSQMGLILYPQPLDIGGKYRSLDVDIKTSLSFWSLSQGLFFHYRSTFTVFLYRIPVGPFRKNHNSLNIVCHLSWKLPFRFFIHTSVMLIYMGVGISLQLSQKIDFAKGILRKCRIFSQMHVPYLVLHFSHSSLPASMKKQPPFLFMSCTFFI